MSVPIRTIYQKKRRKVEQGQWYDNVVGRTCFDEICKMQEFLFSSFFLRLFRSLGQFCSLQVTRCLKFFDFIGHHLHAICMFSCCPTRLTASVVVQNFLFISLFMTFWLCGERQIGLALQSWALVAPRAPCCLVLASLLAFWLHGLSEEHTPNPQTDQALLFPLMLLVGDPRVRPSLR